MKGQLMLFTENHLSVFLSAYRSSYSSQHVLIRLIEEWRQKLNSDHFVGAVLMDLSKAFYCIPHDLLIAKLSAYCLSDEALVYIFSYLSGRKQSIKINNCYSIFQLIFSGVPQGSILGPILFNIFINDIILFIKHANLHNYADDNTITYFLKSFSYSKITLENESAEAINWLKQNNMLVNPKKFKVLFLSRKKELITSDMSLNINSNSIISSDWVKLLGIKFDSRLHFEPHVSDLCKSAAKQLNALLKQEKY